MKPRDPWFCAIAVHVFVRVAACTESCVVCNEQSAVCCKLLCMTAFCWLQFCAHSVIIATGATAKRLGIPKEDHYWASGISACAICDGNTLGSLTHGQCTANAMWEMSLAKSIAPGPDTALEGLMQHPCDHHKADRQQHKASACSITCPSIDSCSMRGRLQ